MSTGQAPVKSSFSRRCSLLSRYLKEKGSFGNIDIGLARKSDLELIGKSDLKDQQNAIKKAETYGGKAKDADYSEPESIVPMPVNSQLTIFFGGKVLVYNEFPEDKAKEIMKAAKEANLVVVADAKNTQNQHMNLDTNVSSKSNMVIPDLNEPTSSGNNNDHEQTKQENQVVERIARRASLHRFFAKRKDRVVARAPYQVNQNGSYPPPKPDMVGPSVEPKQSSPHFATPPIPKRHNNIPMEVDEQKGQHSKDLDLNL